MRTQVKIMRQLEIHLYKLKRYSQTYTIYKKKLIKGQKKETITMIGTSYIEREAL